MLTRKMENLLTNLAKIERGISRIYEYLSTREDFTPPVKRFWKNIMEEELVHEKIFKEVQERARTEDAFQIEIDADINDLKAFVAKLNSLLTDIKKPDVSESEAYTVGATIEAEIDEAHFLSMIRTSDPEIDRKVKRIESDTQKHRMMIINYSRGLR